MCDIKKKIKYAVNEYNRFLLFVFFVMFVFDFILHHKNSELRQRSVKASAVVSKTVGLRRSSTPCGSEQNRTDVKNAMVSLRVSSVYFKKNIV